MHTFSLPHRLVTTKEAETASVEVSGVYLLRLWLQDEDVAVRDAAAAAASAAAAGLLCRLRSATARPTAACGLVGAAPVRESNEQMEETLLLLAAAATPILSDEPHGLEAGTLSQLLLQVLSRVGGACVCARLSACCLPLLLASFCCCCVVRGCSCLCSARQMPLRVMLCSLLLPLLRLLLFGAAVWLEAAPVSAELGKCLYA